MTIICALHREGETWVGSDTQSVYQDMRYEVGPKWVWHGDTAIGVSGQLRAQHAMAGVVKAIDAADPQEWPQIISHAFVSAHFDLHNKDGGPEHTGQQIIVARPEGIWDIDPVLSVCFSDKDFYAAGDGALIASGAAWALRGGTAGFIVANAVKAAIALHVNCGGQAFVSRVMAGK